jgi:hypothetical protein
MKIVLLLLTMVFISCTDERIKVREKDTGGTVTVSTSGFSRDYDLKEFTYKGHLYIYSEVRDGIAMSHAGHCGCGKKY